MAHTPGPWTYGADRNTIATVALVEHIVVGRDCGSTANINYERFGPAEDDARLIAAAPDLLAALQGLVSLFPDPDLDTDVVQLRLLNAALNAIKDATNA
jgi:hypothetical protein